MSADFKERHSREALHRAAPFNKGNKPAFHDPVDNFCKLELWRLTDYEKIVFLDADSLVVKPIDMLFGSRNSPERPTFTRHSRTSTG